MNKILSHIQVTVVYDMTPWAYCYMAQNCHEYYKWSDNMGIWEVTFLEECTNYN